MNYGRQEVVWRQGHVHLWLAVDGSHLLMDGCALPHTMCPREA